MTYFSYFPLMAYDVKADGNYKLAKQILKRVKLRTGLKSGLFLFDKYDIPEGEKPDIDKLESFIIPKGKGVNYNPGVWHFPLIATEDMNFLVVDRKGEGDNLVIYSLEGENIIIDFQT